MIINHPLQVRERSDPGLRAVLGHNMFVQASLGSLAGAGVWSFLPIPTLLRPFVRGAPSWPSHRCPWP